MVIPLVPDIFVAGINDGETRADFGAGPTAPPPAPGSQAPFAWDESKHVRVPAGSAEGGEFGPGGGAKNKAGGTTTDFSGERVVSESLLAAVGRLHARLGSDPGRLEEEALAVRERAEGQLGRFFAGLEAADRARLQSAYGAGAALGEWGDYQSQMRDFREGLAEKYAAVTYTFTDLAEAAAAGRDTDEAADAYDSAAAAHREALDELAAERADLPRFYAAVRADIDRTTEDAVLESEAEEEDARAHDGRPGSAPFSVGGPDLAGLGDLLSLSREEVLDALFDAAIDSFDLALPDAAFYSPDQPRVPPGQRGGGRWAGGVSPGTTAARDAAAGAVRAFARGQGPPSVRDVHAIAGHLAKLTLAQIHALKAEHGLRGSAPNKAALVTKLAERFRAHRAANPAAPALAPLPSSSPAEATVGEKLQALRAQQHELAKPLYEAAWQRGAKTGTVAVRVLSRKQVEGLLTKYGGDLYGGNPYITGVDRGELSAGGSHSKEFAISALSDGRYAVTKLTAGEPESPAAPASTAAAKAAPAPQPAPAAAPPPPASAPNLHDVAAAVYGSARRTAADVYDALREKHPGLTPPQFHALLREAHRAGAVWLGQHNEPHRMTDREREAAVPTAPGSTHTHLGWLYPGRNAEQFRPAAPAEVPTGKAPAPAAGKLDHGAEAAALRGVAEEAIAAIRASVKPVRGRFGMTETPEAAVSEQQLLRVRAALEDLKGRAGTKADAQKVARALGIGDVSGTKEQVWAKVANATEGRVGAFLRAYA